MIKPANHTFDGMYFDYGHQYGRALDVVIKNYRWRHAVRFPCKGLSLEEMDINIAWCEDNLLQRFWRRLGAA